MRQPESTIDSPLQPTAQGFFRRIGNSLFSQRHFHLDHLGTPRLITRAGGERVAYHVYYPFGEEATAFNLDSERMKFTGLR